MAIRIGISVLAQRAQSIGQNGIGQRVMYFAEALHRVPFAESVALFNVGDEQKMPPQVDLAAKKPHIVRMADAIDVARYRFEMGGALDAKWLDFTRARFRKVTVFYRRPCAGHAAKLRHAFASARPSCDRSFFCAKHVAVFTRLCAPASKIP